MSDYIIKVENLGKKYSIQHQGVRERYVALRDIIASKAKAPLRWLRARSAKGKAQSAQRKEYGAWSREQGARSQEQRAERGAQSAKRNGGDASPLPLSPSDSGTAASPLALSPMLAAPCLRFFALRVLRSKLRSGGMTYVHTD